MGGKPRAKTSESAKKDSPPDKGGDKPGPRAGPGDRPSADGKQSASADAAKGKDEGSGGKKGADKTAGTGKKEGAGGRKDAARAGDAKGAGDKPTGPKASGGSDRGPRTSRDYSAKDIRATGDEKWHSERRRHTRGAEKASRAEVKRATGKDTKVATKGVEQHHRADIKEAKRIGLNPDIAGERERMTAVHSRKHPEIYGGEVPTDKDGKVSGTDIPEKDRRTQHNTAARMDKADQAQTARRMGVKGENPQLPKSDAGRRGMIDASGTSTRRWPATGDRTEVKKQHWTREPSGNATAEQSRRAKEIWKAKQAEQKSSGAVDSKDGARAGKSSGRPDDASKARASKVDRPEARKKTDTSKAYGKERSGKASKAESAAGARRGQREAAAKARPKADKPKARPKADAPKATGNAPKSISKVEKALNKIAKTGRIAGAIPKADKPKARVEVDAPKATGDAPKSISKVEKALNKIAKTGRIAGAIGNAFSFAGDITQIIAKDFPELLPEGVKVELRKPKDSMPFMTVPSGYSVEMTNGQVIYRGPDGNSVSKDEALDHSQWTPDDYPGPIEV